MYNKLMSLIEKTPLKKIVNRETVSYAFWGVATSVLNFGVFYILDLLGMDYRAANLIAILSAKVAAYFSSKFFVFHSRCASARELVMEIIRFIAARGFTMIVDYFGLILLVDVLMVDRRIGKLFMTALVVVLNYFISKLAVFNKGKKESKPADDQSL